MINFALKMLEAIGEISDAFVEEAGSMYFDKRKVKKALKYGAIGLAASVGFAGLLWMYKSSGSRRASNLKAS